MNFVGLGFCLADLIFGLGEPLTALVNGIWVLYNTIILSASAYVANESKQIRQTPRVKAVFNAVITKANGRTLVCETTDFSSVGLGLKVPENMNPDWWEVGDQVNVSIFRGDKEAVFPGVLSKSGKTIGIQFSKDMTLHQQKEFAKMTFGRADTWAQMWGKSDADKPLTSFKEVIVFGAVNMVQLIRNGLRRSSVRH
jgi:cellulose synthase (UDP-forming)